MKRFIPLLAAAATLTLLPGRGSAETTLGTPIASLPFTITTPGVYYLVKDLDFTPAIGPAINIKTSDVVLDLNGCTLVGTGGGANFTTGIYCGGFDRVTVQNGSVRKFLDGVSLVSNGAAVRNMLVSANLGTGIAVTGDNAQIVSNRVWDTGGSTKSTILSAIGITITGTQGGVSDNAVQNTFVSSISGRTADGILIKDCSGIIVTGNRVLTVSPVTSATVGVGIVASSEIILMNNTALSAQTGFGLSGGTSGKYGDNITAGDFLGYDTTGSAMTNIGDNN